MIRFMSDTRYAGLEKEMQHIPGFRPRRSGMVISHLLFMKMSLTGLNFWGTGHLFLRIYWKRQRLLP